MFRAILAACMIAGGAQAGEWQTKPVICGGEEETFSTLALMEQRLVYKAMQYTTVKDPDDLIDGLSDNPVLLHMAIYMNLDTGTYTVLEYHDLYKQFCLISYGNQGMFVNGD
tara:strand:+ start:118 stop:453 length:336 start_codon:yes stop_codon:yes gene_type:complete